MTSSSSRPQILYFSNVDEIIINDQWTGFSSTGCYKSHCRLKKDQNRFIGKAAFSVGWHDPMRSNVPLEVPVKKIHVFLDLLACSVLKSGRYTPYLDHTDDYPEVTISLRAGGLQAARFYSASQGQDRAPWKVTVNRHSYVVTSPFPGMGLEILSENLRQDVLRSLLKRAN